MSPSAAARAFASMRLPKSEHVSFRISETGKKILALLQEYYGVSQGNVIEMLLRQAARDLGLPLPAEKKPRNSK